VICGKPPGTALHSEVGQDVIGEMTLAATKTPRGAFLEVGVFRGGTAWHLAWLAHLQQRELYLFDTFTGIPHARAGVDSHKVGDFGGVNLEEVRRALPGAIITAGIFPASADEMKIPPLAFVHLDCDQYQSVKESAEFLVPFMLPGGIMWFDDSPCLGGADQATAELFGDRRVLSNTRKHYVQF
jgi:hypothetical protein